MVWLEVILWKTCTFVAMCKNIHKNLSIQVLKKSLIVVCRDFEMKNRLTIDNTIYYINKWDTGNYIDAKLERHGRSYPTHMDL